MYVPLTSLGNSINSQVQIFTVLRVLVCENRIVYCAGRIRCFPGKRRSQEVQHFIGKHTADSVQTLVTLTARMQEVKTFGLIRHLVQSIKQGMLSHTLQPQVGILNRKKNQLSGERNLWSIMPLFVVKSSYR